VRKSIASETSLHSIALIFDATRSYDLQVMNYFVHRGILKQKSSLGNHFHNNCEEMYVILDGEAQFTVDGRTSQLKAPLGAPCRLSHSHALYNPTDGPVQFLNIDVSMPVGISRERNKETQ
jgi:mannose-6-phosphate isomerase-like protein (cupin superfamily)